MLAGRIEGHLRHVARLQARLDAANHGLAYVKEQISSVDEARRSLSPPGSGGALQAQWDALRTLLELLVRERDAATQDLESTRAHLRADRVLYNIVARR